MSGWRTVAAMITAIFVLIILQSVLAGPTVEVVDTLNGSGDYSNDHFDGGALMDEYKTAWFNAGLLAIFGLMGWAAFRVLKDELTRGGGRI